MNYQGMSEKGHPFFAFTFSSGGLTALIVDLSF